MLLAPHLKLPGRKWYETSAVLPSKTFESFDMPGEYRCDTAACQAESASPLLSREFLWRTEKMFGNQNDFPFPK
jgi:hypothetical protein